MVKAGVYLVARLSPMFATTGNWRTIVVVVGAATMLYGGWRALRQHDLKLLLAYGTVSQLGFLMVLLGSGIYAAAQAGVVLLLAHGAFKAALFMVVGIVDHQVGTRDIRRLHGFGPAWRPVIVISVIGAASMAGFPPLVGFIAKEKALKAALDADVAGAPIAVAAIVVGSILTFAYSSRFVLGVAGRLSDPSIEVTSRDASPPSWSFTAPAALLAAFSVVAGLAPLIIDELVRDATVSLYPDAKPKDVVLWAGFNLALVLSIVIILAGLVLVALRSRIEAAAGARRHDARPGAHRRRRVLGRRHRVAALGEAHHCGRPERLAARLSDGDPRRRRLAPIARRSPRSTHGPT
jgi:multicomponent Na+:H+ antiporter subunit A